jgi:chorismate synthase
MTTFRFLTAGESHGKALTLIIEGLPAGLPLTEDYIALDLRRRQGGYGRSQRQQIEEDRAEILSGVRHGLTLGSPLSLVIHNRDWQNWQDVMQVEPAEETAEKLTRLRPGHADLAGAIKYEQDDVRPVLERASARETAARVAVGAVARRFLEEFSIAVHSHTLAIGEVKVEGQGEPDWAAVEGSPLRCADRETSQRMVRAIDVAREAGDSLGGIFEVWAIGAPIGLGSHVHWDRRLDGRLAQAVMSIHAVKGVGIGGGFGLAKGEPVIVRAVLKPLSTLAKPLPSADLATGEAVEAHYERSDVCVVPAAGVIGEAMVAIVLAEAMLEKFGGDHVDETKRNYQGYLKTIGPKREE